VFPVVAASGPIEEPEIEGGKYQDNSNIRRQPFPNTISEAQDIHAHYDDYH
jgi:hypothetical protein